jgi:sigma-E factor negative regulatory protein RseA
MNRQQSEQISALLDGEAGDGDQTTLHLLTRNESARRVLARYQLISDCLKGNLPSHIDARFAQKIAAALRDEPTVLSPAAAAPRSWLRPVAGFAIAATVAALAVIGIQTNNAARGTAPDGDIGVATVTSPAPARQFTMASGNSQQSNVDLRARQQNTARLNRYLVHYNEYRSNAAVQGMLPYVRIVVHEEQH